MKKLRAIKAAKRPAGKTAKRKSPPQKATRAKKASGRESMDRVIAALAAIAAELRETARDLRTLVEREEETAVGDIAGVVITETAEDFETET